MLRATPITHTETLGSGKPFDTKRSDVQSELSRADQPWNYPQSVRLSERYDPRPARAARARPRALSSPEWLRFFLLRVCGEKRKHALYTTNTCSLGCTRVVQGPF